MSNDRGDEIPGQKRRKLDELFADEPFLSPTMKARRLHEKLHDQVEERVPEKKTEPASQELPTSAYVRSASEQPAPQSGPQLSETYWADSQGGAPPRTVSLVDAAIFLRSKGAQVPRTVNVQAQTRLTAFRDGSLKNWIKAIQES